MCDVFGNAAQHDVILHLEDSLLVHFFLLAIFHLSIPYMYLIVGFEVVSERVSRAASFDVPVSDARPGSSEQAVDVARVLGGVSIRNE